jgi:exodeoxyribonuclease VII small subunit
MGYTGNRGVESAKMTQPIKSDKPPNFETNLERLDNLVRELEDADLPLEKALQLYEEGMKLSEACHKQLEEAEGRVEILRKRVGGKVVTEPFQTDEKEGQ